MISYLKGKLIAKRAPAIVVETNGIGYEVETPMSTYLQLPAVGAEVTILTHFLVREDAQLLYGFGSEDERALFRNLLRGSGVGARIGLAILSGISGSGFRQCVELDDVATLIKVPGIGRKTAERLIIEMRDRLSPSTGAASTAAKPPVEVASDGRGDALQAMVALGYKEAEIRKLIAQVAKTNDAESAEDYIRLCLKQIAGKGAA